jgi:hypothetical protein
MTLSTTFNRTIWVLVLCWAFTECAPVENSIEMTDIAKEIQARTTTSQVIDLD